MGEGILSNYLNYMAALLPTAPQNLMKVQTTSSTIIFDWEDPADDGGAPIIDFHIYWDAGITGGTFVLLQDTTLGMNTYYKSSGLTAGVYYQFKVRASNWIGLSPYSTAITIIAASVADPPISVRRVDSTKSSVTLTWDPAAFTGGTPIRDYQLYWDNGNSAMLLDDFAELINTSYLTRIH